MAAELGGAVRAQITAPPERLWAIVADPTRHPELAGSGEPLETHFVTAGPLGVGSRFESRQKAMKMKYTSNSEVTACQEPRLLRWNVDGTVDWEFRFEPVPAGNGDTRTQVIHQYRWTLKMPGLLRLLLSPLL